MKGVFVLLAALLGLVVAAQWNNPPPLLIDRSQDLHDAAAVDPMCDMYFRRQQTPPSRVHSRDRVRLGEWDHRTYS